MYLVENGVQQVFFQTKWQPKETKPFVLFVGGISPRKGIQDLMRVFRDPRLSENQLDVIGGVEGERSEKCEKVAHPTFVGWGEKQQRRRHSTWHRRGAWYCRQGQIRAPMPSRR